MTDQCSIPDKLDEDWRMVCPNYHHNLSDQAGPTVFCEGCGHAYRYEDLIDKKEIGTRDSNVPTEGPHFGGSA